MKKIKEIIKKLIEFCLALFALPAVIIDILVASPYVLVGLVAGAFLIKKKILLFIAMAIVIRKAVQFYLRDEDGDYVVGVIITVATFLAEVGIFFAIKRNVPEFGLLYGFLIGAQSSSALMAIESYVQHVRELERRRAREEAIERALRGTSERPLQLSRIFH